MILLNGKKVNVTLFPDKTSQIWHLDEKVFLEYQHFITWEFESEADLIHLAQLVQLLRAKCLLSPTIELEVTYLPYARQDHSVSNDSTFALWSFAPLLNTIRFDKVIIDDPHSQIALNIINNSVARYPTLEIIKAIISTRSGILCCPDNGAKNKYSNILIDSDYIYGEKVREQSTGKIISYKLIGDPSGLNVLVLDDIADGCATFIILAKELYKAGAKEVNLFVSHGLFTKGTQILKDAGIKRIFTKEGEVVIENDEKDGEKKA